MSGYYSGIEMGIYCLNRVRLRHRIDRGWRSAKIIDRHLQNPRALLCTILIGNNIANFIAAALFAGILEKRTSLLHAELFTTIILAPILLVFAEVTPKNLFRKKSDTLLYSIAPTLDISHKLFYPLVILLTWISKIPFIFFGNPRKDDYTFLNPRRLMYFFSEGTEDGSLSGYQNLMTRNILKLGGVPVKRVMIPLKDIVSVPYDVDTLKLADLIRNKPFSRLPVYHGRKNDIAGIINLLEFLSSHEEGNDIKRFVNAATYLNESLPVDDALFTLQKARQRMGIVIDKNKKTVGIVTIKDLVEEIVGELTVW